MDDELDWVDSGKSKQHGLSLMEVMLAMGIIAAVVLLVLGLLARFASSQSSTAAQTAAKLLAGEVLDRAAAVGPPGWGFPDPLELEGMRGLTLPNERAPTEFTHRLDALPLRADPASQGTLWELEVEVQWWGGSGGAERGAVRVDSNRVVYVEN